METFLIIISLIWSILVIVLFFKIWNATNDIKAIKDSLGSTTSTNDIVSQFAWAVAPTIIASAIERDIENCKVVSFDEIQSVLPSTQGGYIVESNWTVSLNQSSNPLHRPVTAIIECNNLTKLMDINSWAAKIIE